MPRSKIATVRNGNIKTGRTRPEFIDITVSYKTWKQLEKCRYYNSFEPKDYDSVVKYLLEHQLYGPVSEELEEIRKRYNLKNINNVVYQMLCQMKKHKIKLKD